MASWKRKEKKSRDDTCSLGHKKKIDDQKREQRKVTRNILFVVDVNNNDVIK